MKNSLFINIVIVLIGLVCAVMVIYPLTMLVLGSMALPNIIIGGMLGALLLWTDAFLVWINITE